MNAGVRKYKLIINRIGKRLFTFSPSFYAIICGAFIGTATNLLTSLIFTGEAKINTIILKLAILSIFFSSACFGYISLILEQLRVEATGKDEVTKRKRLLELISDRRKILWSSAIGGFTSVTIGMVLIYYATIS